MASTVDIVLSAVVTDETVETQAFRAAPASITIGVTPNGKREPVTLTAAFTALSPPTGAVAVVIKVISGAVTLTLKGVTGDTGIKMQSAALTSVPICLPLGTSPSIGILSDGAAVLDVLWV